MRMSRRDKAIAKKTNYIGSLVVALEGIQSAAGALLQDQLTQLIERVRYSDPMTDEALGTLEKWIGMDVEALKDDVACGHWDQAATRIQLIDGRIKERNAKCKLLK